MAEVQKLTTSDIPITTPTVENVADAANAGELGTSPTQERSSNSHPHDSEYDTASDLEGGDTSDAEEGGEEYDEDETDLDDESDEDEEDDIENEDAVPLAADGVGSSEKIGEAETQKKVDEDRSNPQYIPKRGTFYEHDDRMADGDNDAVLQIGDAPGGPENVPKGAPKTTSQSPSISHASKTLKKFQQASASERWSHDRFDASEQQPKSDAEIINQYGFNMRNESNPPRARRRRRYARGPNKYDRKWEDENAYIKPPNKDRKPPRASDFPALNERAARKPNRTSHDHEDDKERRDEKENRPDRRRTGGGGGGPKKSSVNERLNLNAPRPTTNQGEDRRDREDLRNKFGGKSAVQSRLNPGATRQPAMEFKQKNRNIRPSSSHQSNNSQNNSRSDERFDRQNQRYTPKQTNYGNTSEDHYQHKQKNASHIKQTQPIQGDVYNNNSSTSNNQASSNMSAKQRTTWQMSSGMQQQQPAHVGSVQMHALASQNQQQQQQLVMGQQPTSNAMIMPPAMSQQQQQQHQHQQQLLQTQPQEQRGPPKRYSSMRRSQHDTQHLPDAHTHQQQQQQLQQMHMQPPPQTQQQQTSQGPQALIMPDQHTILQANLLQMYHQENLQAQMQALQVSQTGPAPQSKQTAYTGVPPTAAQPAPPQPPAAVYGPSPANAAYYVPDAYGASTANSQAPPPATQYAAQQPAFLAAPTQSNAAGAMAYTSQPQPAQSAIPAGPPAAVYAGPQPATNTNQNFSNYQNYNTVGGTTYFVPPAPTTTRPVVLPQRRPTNAIPILHPSEKNKQRAGNENSKDDASKLVVTAQMDSGENIDHIIDNMFVQRPAFQPPQAAMSSISSTESGINNAGEIQTPSQQNSIDLNTLASHASSKASNMVPESSSNSSSSAPKCNEVSPTNNTNSSENSNNNNTITPQE